MEFALDHEEVHDLSMRIFDLLEDSTVGEGMAASLLTAGRLLSPTPMGPEDEQAFLTAAIEWVGLYFTGGNE